MENDAEWTGPSAGQAWEHASSRWVPDHELRQSVSDEQVDQVVARFAALMLDAWQYVRRAIAESTMPSADDLFMLTDPEHHGDPAQRADIRAFKFIEDLFRAAYRRMPIHGEENRPTSLALSNEYPFIAYVDPIDGSAQAWALPGCWGTVVLIQRYVGRNEDGSPQMDVVLAGVVDAEGAVAIGGPATHGVIVVSDVLPGEAVTIDDQTLISQAVEPDGVTGVLNVLFSGYKPAWRESLVEALGSLPETAVIFNVAGAPATRKAIVNPDVVVVQRQASTLWDGIGAYLISLAGGVVIELGHDEPLPKEHVENWFTQLGYKSNSAGQLMDALVVPAFVAGMHWESVVAVARACGTPQTRC